MLLVLWSMSEYKKRNPGREHPFRRGGVRLSLKQGPEGDVGTLVAFPAYPLIDGTRQFPDLGE